MNPPRIRPTFSISLAPDADSAMATLRERLKGTEYEECSRSMGRCADFFVRDAERRVWSPCLSVQVEPVSATGQRLSAHQMEALRERIGDLVEGLEIPSGAGDVASDFGPGRGQSPRI